MDANQGSEQMVKGQYERETMGEPKKRRPRGTVIDRNMLSSNSGEAMLSQPVGGFVDDLGVPVSTADRVSDRVKFPKRKSVIQQICFESSEPPSSNVEPKKTGMKAFDRGRINIDRESLQSNSSHEYDQSDDEQGKSLAGTYGLSDVMTSRVLSHCSKLFSMKVMLDNGPLMRKTDGICIEGELKDSSWRMALPTEKRLANNTDKYYLSVKETERSTEVQDLSFFLIRLAATMALPATFELFDKKPRFGGIGRGFRQMGTTHEANKTTAEDYIPLGEQVESALGMIEDFPSCIDSYPKEALKLIEEVKQYFDDNLLKIEKQEKSILVIITTSRYPWLRGMDNLPETKENFVALMNSFADLPVTFVFIVEAREDDVVQFYDELVSPESSINADVKIAKGLGSMIDGVAKYNPWLNYCLPMHLCQSLGICSNILSQAASRPLCAAEVQEMCNILIGEVPDPADMGKFMDAINLLMSNKDNVRWNPYTGKDSPLIDTVALKRHFNKTLPIGIIAAVLICILAIVVGHLGGYLSFPS